MSYPPLRSQYSAPENGEASDRSVGTAILGAGPAGLTAAYTLALGGRSGAVFEADSAVGGLAKTIEFNGFRFDLGGHRFFTKLEPIARLWEEMLGAELLTRPRLSRIYYDGKYFAYPLQARDVLARLGLRESVLCGFSYLATRARRHPPAESFEDWVTVRFGRRLYDTFFRSYTQKVWGVPGSEIRSEWAAQRIKNFSFWHAVLALAGLRRDVTTLIEEFRYPRLGPGQMWEAFRDRVAKAGIGVRTGERVTAVYHDAGRARGLRTGRNGAECELDVDAVLSSIPLSELVLALEPTAPAQVRDAAKRLRYRDLCVVCLMIDRPEPFPDNWIYLHDPSTRAGRVQNFGAWSADMVVPGTTCLGVEYFCFEGDDIWELSEEDAGRLAIEELARIGLLEPAEVTDTLRVRVPKAYPMYDADYREAVEVCRRYLDQFENLKTFGRNGLHRYNNQDHSMWTAILATLNLLEGTDYDVWSVNTEAKYHEGGEMVNSLLAGSPFSDAVAS